MKIGTKLSAALARVGVDEDRVSRWLGRPCGCKARRDKLDLLGAWAARILTDKLDHAVTYLFKLMGEE